MLFRSGLEVLLEAMKLLAEQNLPVRLKCVGGFESEKYELDSLVNDKQKILGNFWPFFVGGIQQENQQIKQDSGLAAIRIIRISIALLH